MDIQFDSNSCVVFDLDDTLYKEIDFLKSAYRQIALYLEPLIGKNIYKEMLALYSTKNNVFESVITKYKLKITSSELIEMYRFHSPNIKCSPHVIAFLKSLKKKNCKLGIITDGRTITQQNKIKSLKINDLIDFIVISEAFGSEKPNEKNYLFFENLLGKNYSYTYIGDNIKKDFVSANHLGWQTIGIKDNGKNIHSQFVTVEQNFYPQKFISSFKELL